MCEKINKIANDYKNLIIKQIPDIDTIVLYGSYTKNTAHENSDIDIAVILKRIEEDYLNLSSKLFKLVRKIDTRIEPILLSLNNDKAGFIPQILKDGIILYKSEN
ncbi:MAG: nucleotidyltransferase domain-containing protein [Candidatus Muiribacteriota bacterium]|jgi:predicted nucleotidyltransferase